MLTNAYECLANAYECLANAYECLAITASIFNEMEILANVPNFTNRFVNFLEATERCEYLANMLRMLRICYE